MSLLAILISLILEKLLPPTHGLRSLAWIESYQQWVHTRLTNHPKWRGTPSLLIIVLPPLTGIATLQYLLNDLLVFLGFVFSIIVLTYSLGPKNKRQLAREYLDAEERGDTGNAESMLQDIVSSTTSTPLPEDKLSRTRRLTDYLLIQTHEQLLAIFFWFVILGPMGAMLYRLTVELQQAGDATETGDAEFHAAVIRLHYILAWIPGRLTALSYAVMGSFVHALHAWQNASHEEIDTNNNTSPQIHHLLLHIGQAALQLDKHPPQDDSQHNDAIRETLDLCGRSLVAWITVLALMTLAGWAS